MPITYHSHPFTRGKKQAMCAIANVCLRLCGASFNCHVFSGTTILAAIPSQP